MPIRTGNSNTRCAATAASTADLGDANAAHTPSPVCLNNQPPCASIAAAQHLVMGGQRRPHRFRVGLPPTGRTLHIGEQERHHPRRSSRRRSGHTRRISQQTRSYQAHRRNPALQATSVPTQPQLGQKGYSAANGFSRFHLILLPYRLIGASMGGRSEIDCSGSYTSRVSAPAVYSQSPCTP